MKDQATPNRYYLLRDNQEIGPYTITQVRGMWNAGAITVNTEFRRDGENEWQPLSKIIAILEPESKPQTVAVANADPFAEFHTEIQGKKPGEITFIGFAGIILGIIMIFGGGAILVNGRTNDEAQAGIVTATMGMFFLAASFLWARAPQEPEK